MITIDDKELKELERDFKAYAKRAFPFATKATVNSAAFQTQKAAKGRIKEKLINRNRFTEQSVRVEQARTLAVSRQEAIVGSIADYMETQEFGGSKKRTGRHGVAITTSYAAGLGEKAKPRTKLARKPNRLQTIQLKKRKASRLSNPGQIKAAAAAGEKFIFLDLGRKKGIFRLLGGKRRPKIRMVQDLSEQSVTIKATPWLRPAVEEIQKKLPEIYRDAMVFQARRNKLFGYK